MPEAQVTYSGLADVIEWRRNACPSDWVSFASGEPLDKLHPVVALVRGWERQGLVEVAQDRKLGWLRHRFRRLSADYPEGWFGDKRFELPSAPPARRVPESLGFGRFSGIAAMASIAADRGDEHAAWVWFAVESIWRELARLSADVSEVDRLRHLGYPTELPPGIGDAVAAASILLGAISRMMDPAAGTVLQVRIGGRKPGRVPNPSARARKIQAAATEVREAVVRGEKKDAAILAAARQYGLSESLVKKALALERRLELEAHLKPLRMAARLVDAMTTGGMLRAKAAKHLSETLSLQRTDLIKYMQSKDFHKNREKRMEFWP